MNKVLLFGGTGEGRALAEWMAARGIPCLLYTSDAADEL